MSSFSFSATFASIPTLVSNLEYAEKQSRIHAEIANNTGDLVQNTLSECELAKARILATTIDQILTSKDSPFLALQEQLSDGLITHFEFLQGMAMLHAQLFSQESNKSGKSGN